MSGTTLLDPDEINSDDDLPTQIMKFLDARISDEDMAMVEMIFANFYPEYRQAMDTSARKRVAMDAAGQARYLAMFPNSGRLNKRGY